MAAQGSLIPDELKKTHFAHPTLGPFQALSPLLRLLREDVGAGKPVSSTGWEARVKGVAEAERWL